MSTTQSTSPGSTSLEPVLCVDLDGTLIEGDCLKFSVATILRRRPWTAGGLLFDLRRGRAWFKKRVADRYLPDAETLCYRREVIEWLARQRQGGRRLVLATAADERTARKVACHLGLFSDVIACDGVCNPKGAEKVRRIREQLSVDAFDYVCDSLDDVVVFAAARRGYLVGNRGQVRAAVAGMQHVRHLSELVGEWR